MDRLRVLTFNIWNRQGPWEERLELIRRGIAALSPDLVGLQEVLRLDGSPPDQAEQIAADLGYHLVWGPAFSIGGGLHFGNAILSRFAVVAEHHLQLPLGTAGGEEGRALVGAEVDAPCGRVPFFVTHLSWKFSQGLVRQEQVSAIVRRIDELYPPGHDPARYPAILVGDFNAEPLSDEIRFLYGWHALEGRTVYWADCFHVAGDGGAGHTFVQKNPYAAVVHEPDRRLDYVFVRGPDRLVRGKPLACRVVLDTPEGGVFPSDHFGVYAELSVGAGSKGHAGEDNG